MDYDLAPVIHRIIFPGLFLFALGLSDFLHKYFDFRRSKDKKYFRDGIILLVIGLFGLSLSAYFMGDIVYKDFVTASGEMINYGEYGRHKITFFVEGEPITVNISSSMYQDLSPESGEYFEFTYAPRTEIIVEVHQINAD